jgi:hypothetical protein
LVSRVSFSQLGGDFTSTRGHDDDGDDDDDDDDVIAFARAHVSLSLLLQEEK